VQDGSFGGDKRNVNLLPNINLKKKRVIRNCFRLVITLLLTALIIYMNFLAFNVLSDSLSTTAETYSILGSPIPREELDSFLKNMEIHFILCGVSGAAIMSVFILMFSTFRKIPSDNKMNQSETNNGSRKDKTEDN